MISVAKRESNFNHLVRAKSEADAKGARRAWERNKQKYVDAGSKHIAEIEQTWLTSWGLYQLMMSNHLQRWGHTAHPRVLTNPIVATVIAGRLFNRAVARGAKNLCDVRQLWATGNLSKGPKYEERCASEKARFKALGYPVSLVTMPIRNWGMAGFGTAPQSSDLVKYQAVAAKLGLPSDPEAPVPPEWSPGQIPNDDTGPDDWSDDHGGTDDDPDDDSGDWQDPGQHGRMRTVALAGVAGVALWALMRPNWRR
jgi:hypothetical protein